MNQSLTPLDHLSHIFSKNQQQLKTLQMTYTYDRHNAELILYVKRHSVRIEVYDRDTFITPHGFPYLYKTLFAAFWKKYGETFYFVDTSLALLAAPPEDLILNAYKDHHFQMYLLDTKGLIHERDDKKPRESAYGLKHLNLLHRSYHYRIVQTNSETNVYKIRNRFLSETAVPTSEMQKFTVQDKTDIHQMIRNAMDCRRREVIHIRRLATWLEERGIQTKTEQSSAKFMIGNREITTVLGLCEWNERGALMVCDSGKDRHIFPIHTETNQVVLSPSFYRFILQIKKEKRYLDRVNGFQGLKASL